VDVGTMAKTRFDTRGIKSALKRINFSENTYYRAVAEYIWNGFDANASIVELNYEVNQGKRKAHFRKLSIKDNGKGIEQYELNNKFEPLFDSEKLDNDISENNQSAIHGKLGVGRLTFFTFANFASWDTTFSKDGRQYNYGIKIDASNLDYFTGTESDAKEVKSSTGTEVKFDGFMPLEGKDNLEDELIDYLIKEFCWFLELNTERNFQLVINGKPLDYSSFVGDRGQFETIHKESEEKFHVRYIRWAAQLNKEYSRFYYLNHNKVEQWKETTKLNNQGDNFYHSVFITSSYFDNFNFTSSETSSQKALMGGVRSDESFKYLMEEVYKFLKQKRKPFLRIHSGKVYSEYKEEGIIIVNENDPLNIIEANEFEGVFKELYELQPKFFTNLRKEQKKIFVGVLQLLLKSDEREGLLDILRNIIDLDKTEREDLQKILSVHKLQRIIKTMDLITERIRTVEVLKQIVFKKVLKANERDHLQKVIEENYWFFGEQYHLISKDETFQKSLERYLYILDTEKKKPDSTGRKSDRMDIFLCQRWKLNSVNNIIVELKNPKIRKLTDKEYLQVDRYRTAIMKDPEFNSTIAEWKFILVGQDIDDFIKNLIKSNQHHGEPSLANKVDNFTIYVKTWSQLFDEIEISHEWLNKKLEIDKNKIIEDFATVDEAVKKAIESSAASSKQLLGVNP